MVGSDGNNGVPVVRRRRRKSRAERVLDAFLGHALRRRRGGRMNLTWALDAVFESDPLGYIKLALWLDDFKAEQAAEAETPPFEFHISHFIALLDRGPGAIDDDGSVLPPGQEKPVESVLCEQPLKSPDQTQNDAELDAEPVRRTVAVSKH